MEIGPKGIKVSWFRLEAILLGALLMVVSSVMWYKYDLKNFITYVIGFGGLVLFGISLLSVFKIFFDEINGH